MKTHAHQITDNEDLAWCEVIEDVDTRPELAERVARNQESLQ